MVQTQINVRLTLADRRDLDLVAAGLGFINASAYMRWAMLNAPKVMGYKSWETAVDAGKKAKAREVEPE